MDLMDLYVRIVAKDEASDEVEGIGEKIKRGVKGLAVGAAVGAAAGAVVDFGKEAVGVGMNFDASMSQVAATMGYTTDELADSGSEAAKTYKQLQAFAKRMGRETAFSASQSADALNYMALAGYDAETSMSMLPTVLNLAAAGGLDLADASDMVTDAQSALGLSLEETQEMVDKMAMASSKSNTSVGQLGEAFLTVGGTAQSLSGGTTELSTALGILADNGIKGAEGGTALRNIILSLGSPTDIAAAKMEELGLQVYDAEGNMRPLNETFGDLDSILSTMTEQERTEVLSTLFNKVDLKSANALLANSGERFDELSGYIDSATGSAEAMAEVQLDNLEGDVTIMKSAFEGLQIAISDQVSPALRDFVQGGTELLGGLTAAIEEGGLLGGIQFIGQSFWNALGDAKAAFDEALPKIVQWFEELPGKAGAALGDLAGSLYEKGVEFLGGLQAGAQEGGETLGAWIFGLPGILVNHLPEIQTWLVDKGREFLRGFLDGGQEMSDEDLDEFMVNLPATLLGKLGDLTTTLFSIGADFLQGFMNGAVETGNNLVAFFQSLPDTLASFVTGLVDFLAGPGADFLQGFMNGVASIGAVLLPYFEALPGVLGGALGDLVGYLLEKGSQFLQGFFDGSNEVGGTLVEYFTSLPGVLLGFLGDVANFLLGAGQDFLGGFFTGVGRSAPDIVNFFTSLPQTMLNLLGDLKTFLTSKGEEFLNGLADGAKSAGAALGTWVSNLPQTVLNILSGITNLATMLGGIGKDLLSGMLNGIKNLFDGGSGETVSSFVKGIPDKVLGFLKGAADIATVLMDAGKDFIAGFLDGLGFKFDGADAENVTSFMSSIPGKLLDALGDLSQTLWQSGVDLISGLVGGLGDFVTDPIGFIIDLANGMVGGFEDTTDEHSPSKVMEQRGEWFVDGLTQGLENKEDDPDATLTGIASGLPDNFVDAYWEMHDKGVALMNSFGTGLTNAFYGYGGVGNVASDMTRIANSIAGYFGGYYTLWSAGQNIMAGLGDSMVSYFYNYVAWQLRSITSMIPMFKGPLDKDKVLLRENGAAIMGGLVRGIEEGESELYSVLGGITDEIPSHVDARVGVDVSDPSVAERASTVTRIDATRMFDGAVFNFSSRDDLEQFSQMLNDWVDTTNRGAFANAS